MGKKDLVVGVKERLFNYFIQEHGITLLESQLEDIINIVSDNEHQILDDAVEAVKKYRKKIIAELSGQGFHEFALKAGLVVEKAEELIKELKK